MDTLRKSSLPAQVVLALIVTLVLFCGMQPNETMGAFTAQLTSENSAGVGGATALPQEKERRNCAQTMADTSDALFVYRVALPHSGRTLEDLSANGNRGMIRVPAVKSVFANPCRHDETVSASFPGKSNHSYVTTSQQVRTPEDATEELWLRTTATEGTLMGFYTSQTPDGGHGQATLKLNIDPATGGLLFSTAVEEGYATAVSATRINDGQWHHIVARREAGILEVFTDGTFVASAAEDSPAVAFNAFPRIGCDNQTGWPHLEHGSECFQGDIAFAAAYGRALSDEEITEHYYAAQ